MPLAQMNATGLAPAPTGRVVPLATPALDIADAGRMYPSLASVPLLTSALGLCPGDVVQLAGMQVTLDPFALGEVDQGRTRLDILAEVFARMAQGETVKQACAPYGLTAMALYSWSNRSLSLGTLYLRARELQAHGMADAIVSLAQEARKAETNEQAAAYRLEVDARKWMASKIAPKLYGERTETHATSEIRVTVTRAEVPQEVAGRWAEVRATVQQSDAHASEVQATQDDTESNNETVTNTVTGYARTR